jgi:proteic killer suppression protein
LDIMFGNSSLERACNDAKRAQRQFGEIQAKLLRRRLDELHAAETLSVMRSIPQARCHELRGNLAGRLSVDLKHPYRLIFRPASSPVPLKPDGGLDWTRVTVIEILGVEDTHE